LKTGSTVESSLVRQGVAENSAERKKGPCPYWDPTLVQATNGTTFLAGPEFSLKGPSIIDGKIREDRLGPRDRRKTQKKIVFILPRKLHGNLGKSGRK